MVSIRSIFQGLFLLMFCLASAQDLKTLKVEDVSIEYPPRWEVDTSGFINSKFIIRAPADSKNDRLKEYVMFNKSDLKKKGMNMDLEQFHQRNKFAHTKNDLIGSFDEHSGMNGNHPFKALNFNTSIGGLKVNVHKKYFVINGIAYILVFMGETSKMGEYYDIKNQIISSFKIE